MYARTVSTTLASDWSHLVLHAKHLGAAGLIVIGLVGGAILAGDWRHAVSVRPDDGHGEMNETRGGPPQVIGAVEVTPGVATTALTRPGG
jgi:hypothetical protein